MMPLSRTTCLIIRPVTSKMRVPVSRQVSLIRRFSSSILLQQAVPARFFGENRNLP